jgi:tetratricopeptide (TPR) repeat protein
MAKLGGKSDHPNVMISSTYSDLVEHREAVVDALLRLGLFPIGMEFDSAKAGKDVITSSMEMVSKAHAYVGIVSHNYGGVPKDAGRNRKGVSITELEYREALKLGIPVYMFLMSDEHPVKSADVEAVSAKRKKLKALKDDARSRSIYAEFFSVEQLKFLVLQSMASFKEELAVAGDKAEPAPDRAQGSREMKLPSPPQLLAIPDFVSGHEFVGRRAEFAWLDEWAEGSDPIMVIEAIGGMGKSTLAWEWLKERATAVRPDFAGSMWYSFYEGGADMAAFAAYALAYITGQPLEEFRGRKTADLAHSLIAALQKRPVLLVLDGLERVLVAYHRLDASQARDDQVASDRDHRACIKPADGDLLRLLVAAKPSKFLITSRLMPAALANKSGQDLYGVRHRSLGGLHSDDALTMMRNTGGRGDETTVRRYLGDHFDNHPLMVGIVAGLVNDYFREPGNFDRWADDPQGGADLHLAGLDLSQRRTHILAAALTGLEPTERQLLSRIAALGGAVPFATVAVLNPFMPPAPQDPSKGSGFDYDIWRLKTLQSSLEPATAEEERARIAGEISETRARIEQVESDRAAHARALEEYSASEEVRQAVPKLVSALQDLERRGLLQWDRSKNSYDLHPVVRGYAFDILEQPERADICNRIADHFQSRPPDRYADARTLADLQQSISIFRALIQAGRFDDAASFYRGSFSHALVFSVEAYHEVLTLLKALFPYGFQKPPSAVESRSAQSYLLNAAGLALKGLQRLSDARDAYRAGLQIDIVESEARDVVVSLINLARVYAADRRISTAFAALNLALELADALDDEGRIAVAHLDLMCQCRDTGLFERGEASYQAFRGLPLPTDWAIYSPGDAEEEYCWLSFFQGRLTEEQLDEAEAIAQAGDRITVRRLAQLRGELALQRRDAQLAISAFERAIEMTQAIGLPAGGIQARIAFAKATEGDCEEARAICDALHESERPEVELAEAYLQIGDREKARHHALKGYSLAWAEGPPYSRWWHLERSRAVLKTLGEHEPDLPAFDPTSAEPVPFEAEIRKLIADLKEEKKESAAETS